METSLGVIITAAVIAATAVDILKDVTPIRRLFNRWTVQRWLWRGLGYRVKFWPQLLVLLKNGWLDGKIGTDHDVERTVVNLAAAGDTATLYRPGLAQVAAQLNILAEHLLDFPADRRRVMCALAGVAEPVTAVGTTKPVTPAEAAKPATPAGAAKPVTPVEAADKEYAHVYEKVDFGAPDLADARADVEALCALKGSFRAAITAAERDRVPTLGKVKAGTADDAHQDDAGTLMDRRSRVTSMMQRRLDQLQVTGRISWRVLLLVVATLIGAIVCNSLGPRSSLYSIELMPGVFAGILATVAHEALAILRRAGQR